MNSHALTPHLIQLADFCSTAPASALASLGSLQHKGRQFDRRNSDKLDRSTV
ncbi:MAG: hypothetical protein J7642_23080 [Cyanobacteria bacterium SBC]|nr:hypothetical protein [Cyanobacteria bacterium SBC]